jgi:crossover junction endodeoxyribonuclease RusA
MISLPFPPASLSGHNTGHWGGKSHVIAKHREWACTAAKAENIGIPQTGDILLAVRFIPRDNRGDRLNFPNRMKPYFDGIAEGLGVNDKRFVPYYVYDAPSQPGEVQVTVIPVAILPRALRSFEGLAA